MELRLPSGPQASDSPPCLTYRRSPLPVHSLVLTTAGTCQPRGLTNRLSVLSPDLWLQLPFCFLSFRCWEAGALSRTCPKLSPQAIWAPRAKPCQSTNSCTAASPNLRCSFGLHFPFHRPGAPWAPSYRSHPALSPLSYEPRRVCIRSPSA